MLEVPVRGCVRTTLPRTGHRSYEWSAYGVVRMFTRVIVAAAITAGIAILPACDMIAPSKCNTGNCVVTVEGTTSEGLPVFQASNAPSTPPMPYVPTAAEQTSCAAVHGDFSEDRFFNDFKWVINDGCNSIPYLDTAGEISTITSLGFDSSGNLAVDPQLAIVDNSTRQECASGNFPNQVSSPGPGIWNARLGFCESTPAQIKTLG